MHAEWIPKPVPVFLRRAHRPRPRRRGRTPAPAQRGSPYARFLQEDAQELGRVGAKRPSPRLFDSFRLPGGAGIGCAVEHGIALMNE